MTKPVVTPELLAVVQARFPGKTIVTLDLETHYDKGYSLTNLTYPEYIFDDRFYAQGVGIQIDAQEAVYYEAEFIEAALHEIDWENTVLIAQNTKFDASILKWVYDIEAAFYIDTADLSRIHWPGLEANLEDICLRMWPDDPDRHKGKELANFKGFRELNEAQQRVMSRYCRQDCALEHLIACELIPLTPQTELILADLTLRMYINPVFKLDRPLVEEFLEAEKAEVKEKVKASGLGKTVLSSNKKFVEWMEAQGIEVPTKISPNTGKVTPALGQKDPAFLRTMADYPEFKHVWVARAAVKSTINQSRAARLLQLDELLGFIPVPLVTWGAHTGRWSGTQKINMQNLPRGGTLRLALTVPDTHRIHVADSSNIEARMLAWLAGHAELLADFRNKVDVYSKQASSIYGYPVDRKAKDENGNKLQEEEGNVGKTATLGLGYGMGHSKFRHTLASGPMGSPPILVSEQFARNAVDTYRADNRPVVELWRVMDRIGYDMMMPGCDYHFGPLHITYQQIGLPNGTALKYHNLRIEEEKDADGNLTGKRNLVCDRRNGKKQKLYGGILTENVVQALSKIVVAEQALDCLEQLPYAKVALLVHDEIVLVLPYESEEESQRCQEIVEACMRIPRDWCPDLPLDSEGGYALEYSK